MLEADSADGLSIRNPLAAPDEWDEEMGRLAGASPFHTSGWLRVLVDTYGFEPLFLCSPGAVMPLMGLKSWLTGNKGVGLPFSDFCPALGDAGQFPLLWEAAKRLGKQRAWKYVECRGLDAAFLPGGPSITYVGHLWDLRRSEQELSANLKSATRRSMRKVEKAATQHSIETDAVGIQTFYELHCRTRKKHGLPPQSFVFFRNIQRSVLAKGQGFVSIVRKDGRPLAAYLFLHAHGKAVYKFGASDERIREFSPSTLALWQGALHCRGLGCESLHLGRTAENNEGLRRFKMGFGAVEEPVHYFHFNLASASIEKLTDKSEGWANRYLRHLPSWLARGLGAFLYKHLT